MTILVTGATGRVGGQVVQQLVQRGADVRVLVRDPAKADFPAGVEVVQGDLLDVDSLRSAMPGASTLFLLNGVVADEYTQALIRNHAQACTVTLVGAARLASLAEDALSGKPVSDVGRSGDERVRWAGAAGRTDSL